MLGADLRAQHAGIRHDQMNMKDGAGSAMVSTQTYHSIPHCTTAEKSPNGIVQREWPLYAMAAMQRPLSCSM
jgi:hypothetical protein